MAEAAELNPDESKRNDLERQPSLVTTYGTSQKTDDGKIQVHVEAKKPKKHVRRFLKSKRGALMPSGLLSIHVKSLNLHEIDVYSLFERYDVCIYLRIWVNTMVKYSVMYSRVKLPINLLFDELKHFRVNVSDVRTELCNHIRFEVVFTDPSDRDYHKIISAKDIHVYDIIKDLFDIKHLELRDLHKQKAVGDLNVEMTFAYGTFGYGFANQFHSRLVNPKDNLSHSIFFRPPPMDGRVDSINDTTVCRHIGHPPMIPFKRKAELDMYVEFQAELDWFFGGKVREPNVVTQRLTERVEKIQHEVDLLTSRKERLHFLRSWVSDSEAHVPVNHSTFRLKPGFLLQQRAPKMGPRPAGGRKSEVGLLDPTDMATFSVVAEHAPAVIKKKQPGSNDFLPSISEHPKQEPHVPPVTTRLSDLSNRLSRSVSKASGSISSFIGNLTNMSGVFKGDGTEEKSTIELTTEENEELQQDRAQYSYDDHRYSWHM